MVLPRPTSLSFYTLIYPPALSGQMISCSWVCLNLSGSCRLLNYGMICLCKLNRPPLCRFLNHFLNPSLLHSFWHLQRVRLDLLDFNSLFWLLLLRFLLMFYAFQCIVVFWALREQLCLSIYDVLFFSVQHFCQLWLFLKCLTIGLDHICLWECRDSVTSVFDTHWQFKFEHLWSLFLPFIDHSLTLQIKFSPNINYIHIFIIFFRIFLHQIQTNQC